MIREVVLVVPSPAILFARADGKGEAVAPSVRRIEAPLGRASQMNAGARAAETGHLLFLHADSEVEPAALREMAAHLARRADGAVAFSLRFASNRRSLRVLSALAAARDHLVPFPLGDQGLGLSTRLFARVGGFRDEPLFEDAIMTRSLRACARVVVLSATIRTSPRRFVRRGVWRAFGENIALAALFAARVSPRTLVRAYYGRDYLDRWCRADPARTARAATAARWRPRAAVAACLALIAALLFAVGARGDAPTPELFDAVLGSGATSRTRLRPDRPSRRKRRRAGVARPGSPGGSPRTDRRRCATGSTVDRTASATCTTTGD